jgi:hypothetical protein
VSLNKALRKKHPEFGCSLKNHIFFFFLTRVLLSGLAMWCQKPKKNNFEFNLSKACDLSGELV